MTERDDPQWLMGALAADDAYRGDAPAWPLPPQPGAAFDNPWARGVAIADDYTGRGTPPLSATEEPPQMGSLLGMGRAGETALDMARTVPGAIVRGGVEAAKFAGHLGTLEDPSNVFPYTQEPQGLDRIGREGEHQAEQQIEAQLYQPQTTPGEYTNAGVKTMANPFNAIGRGAMAVKQVVNLLSGLAGEWGARAYPEHPDLARNVFGFLPGVAGHALPAADAALQRAPGNTVGAVGGKAVIPSAPAPGSKAWRDASNADALFAQYTERYPEVGPPVMTPKDNPKFAGEMYPAKALTPEAAAFDKARAKIMTARTG